MLDEAVDDDRREQYELLAPAIDRVWHDEIGAIRRDLRLWVDEIARAGGEWVPRRFEWAFGYEDGGALAVGRDPTSRREPVTIDGRFQLHGSIDLVEEHAATGELRVTDHKTGKYRGKESHDGRRRRRAAAGAVLARARAGDSADPWSKDGCTTRRPPADTATSAFR